jgi:predicted Zn-dependent peptidase
MLPSLYQSSISNGIRVISQPTQGLQGIAVAIHIASGSRNEDPSISGASHFIEHLLFKGTERRTSSQMISEFDAIGVDPNAQTSQEGVTYYFTVLREYLPKAFELLSDMFLNSTFPEKELETERMVIIEEITRGNDDHAHFLANQFCGGYWNEHPLGRPVIGFQETVSKVSRDDLISHMRQHYLPSLTIVTAAGNVDHDELVAVCEKHLGGFAAPNNVMQTTSPSAANLRTGLGYARHTQRNMEQLQLYLGYPALLATDKRYAAFKILNNVLGCGMGSRLFREVREVRGLAYSVGSAIWGFSDSAALIVYVGCDVGHAQEAVAVCHGEVMRLVHEKLTPDFLADAKRQARGRLLLGLDDPCARAMDLAYDFSQVGKVRSVAEELADIEAVTPEVMQEIAEEMFCCEIPRLESIGPEVALTLPS